MRRAAIVVIIAGLALGTAADARALPYLIPVQADASVQAQAPTTNFGAGTFRGGLQTGATEFGELFRFYLKFDLSAAFAPGLRVESAMLRGFYNDDYDFFANQTHSFYLAASDGWTESGITWNNQPGVTGLPVSVFDASAYDSRRTFSAGFLGLFLSWDVSTAVNMAFQTDLILSLVLRANNETLGVPNLEYFASKEFNPNLAFRLELDVVPVPEPVSLLLFGSGLALTAYLSSTSRQKRLAVHTAVPLRSGYAPDLGAGSTARAGSWCPSSDRVPSGTGHCDDRKRVGQGLSARTTRVRLYVGDMHDCLSPLHRDSRDFDPVPPGGPLASKEHQQLVLPPIDPRAQGRGSELRRERLP